MQDQPDYRLTIEDHTAYLYASVAADAISANSTVAYSNAISLQLRNSGHHKLLFVRQCPLLEPWEHSLTTHLMRDSLPSRVTIASVDEYDNSPSGIAANDLASNAAGFDVRTFTTVEAADDWLRSLV
ncbi:MAG TPA: hypothetical protein VL501_10150 [Pyrinomonadaceae bacterium]|nr:hypothetical protein [Pyrinomonadaceae bacterium]